MQISKATRSVVMTPAQEQTISGNIVQIIHYPPIHPGNFARQIPRMNVEREGWLSC